MEILTRPCGNSNMLKNWLSRNYAINIKYYLFFSKLKISNRIGQNIFRIPDNPAHVTRSKKTGKHTNNEVLADNQWKRTLLIKGSYVFIINKKMESTSGRIGERIEKIVDSYYISNKNTNRSYT